MPPLPPGVTLAPVGRRIGAFFLSILLSIVTLYIGYLVWGLFFCWPQGTTPALKVLKMRCVKADTGAKATFGTIALRDILGRFVEGIFWITELVSFVLFLARGDRRSLHDLIGGTIVVHDPEGRLDAVS